jgi:hypothetical protein
MFIKKSDENNQGPTKAPDFNEFRAAASIVYRALSGNTSITRQMRPPPGLSAPVTYRLVAEGFA